jgi:hypothetical protein
MENTDSSAPTSRSAVIERSTRCSSDSRVCSPTIDAILIALPSVMESNWKSSAHNTFGASPTTCGTENVPARLRTQACAVEKVAFGAEPILFDLCRIRQYLLPRPQSRSMWGSTSPMKSSWPTSSATQSTFSRRSFSRIAASAVGSRSSYVDARWSRRDDVDPEPPTPDRADHGPLDESLGSVEVVLPAGTHRHVTQADAPRLVDNVHDGVGKVVGRDRPVLHRVHV